MTRIEGGTLARHEAERSEAHKATVAAEAKTRAARASGVPQADVLVAGRSAASPSRPAPAVSTAAASPFAFATGFTGSTGPRAPELAPPLGHDVDLGVDGAAMMALGAVEVTALGSESAGGEPLQHAANRVRAGMMLTLDDAAELYSGGRGLERGLVTQLAQALDAGNESQTELALHTTLTSARAPLPLAADVNALVQAVLRESYLLQCEVLRDYAEKVKTFNEQKKRIRAELQRARQTLASAGALADDAELESPFLPEVIDPAEGAAGGAGGAPAAPAPEEEPPPAGGARSGGVFAERQKGDPILTKGDLEAYVASLEERLETVGDDAQLANLDLQNALQQQQQTMQMMSNVSKMIHETAMSIIRKIGG